tara:strand:- start:377 stop:955 length:579 start_codon:yes stop_codon:yes gene_type:complete
MGRKDNVIDIRRAASVLTRATFPERPRLKGQRRSRILKQQKLFAVLCVAVLVLPLGIRQVENPVVGQAVPAPASFSITRASVARGNVYWIDGDSGHINGKQFRLHGVDAPEGSPSRAKCNRERSRANDARYAVRTLTMGKKAIVKRSHGVDKYGRELVDLSVDGKDITITLIARGHLKRWRYGHEAKPDWCR